jgi:hypothetical protein
VSDEREKKTGRLENDDVQPDDVEAHVKAKMNDEAESDDGDDVEAHVRSHRT